MCVHTKFSIYARISARQSLKLQISNLCSCISCHTVLLFNSPWSSPFSKILEVVSRPEFAQYHESGLRSDRGPVVLCDFSKLRYWKSPYKFFKFVWEILPIQPTIQTRKKISPPSFFSKMRTFFKKLATLVVILSQFRLQPTWPIFEKCSHLQKGGVLRCFFKRPAI